MAVIVPNVEKMTLAEAKNFCRQGQAIFIDSDHILILEKSDVKNFDDYKKRLKDYLIDKFSFADEDKPSMISVAALLRNELLREIYNDIVNDRI